MARYRSSSGLSLPDGWLSREIFIVADAFPHAKLQGFVISTFSVFTFDPAKFATFLDANGFSPGKAL